MKRPWLVAAMLALALPGAWAQSVHGRVFASSDSDDFDERVVHAGYTGAEGWGLKAGTMYYRAPGWRAHGRTLAATYDRTAAGRHLNASLGVARVDGHTHLVGLFDAIMPVADGASVGISLERDVVNSAVGVREGLSFTNVALVGDYAFTPRLNLGLAGGATLFSDHNRRPYLRTRLNYSLNEDLGLNAYVKTRSYRNSDPGRPAYFSPRRLHEASVGLSARFAVAERLVVSTSVDAGHQRANSYGQPIWSWSLGIASHRSSRIGWGLALVGSNSASMLGGDVEYRYTSLVAHLRVPL